MITKRASTRRLPTVLSRVYNRDETPSDSSIACVLIRGLFSDAQIRLSLTARPSHRESPVEMENAHVTPAKVEFRTLAHEDVFVTIET